MKISTIVKIKKGYVWIDTTKLDSPFGNLLDSLCFGNPDAIADEFETMVFPCNKNGEIKSWEELDARYYSIEKEAKKGHEKMVKIYENQNN